MASYINTNIASLNAQRNLSTSSTGLTTALQRLSSGLRINSAKDDAAGLAISQRTAAQIGGLNQAARNANDAISLAQTAEGALSTVTDNLQRLRTLAVQAANSTNSDSDRATIQLEVSQLVSEIGRVADTTEFNGIKLLNGSFKDQVFHVGANANQTISVSMDSATTDKLGSTQAAALTAFNNGTAISSGDVTINGVSIGSSVASSDSASTTGNAASAIAKAAAINAVSGQTGVTATANANTLAGTAQTATVGVGAIFINGVTVSTSVSMSGDAKADRDAVVTAINAKSGQTGVTAIAGSTAAEGVKLVAADGRNIELKISDASGVFTSASTGLAADSTATVTYGTYTLTSSKAITVSGSTSNVKNAGLIAGSFSTQTAAVNSRVGTANAFAAGDFKINGVLIGASQAASDTASNTGNNTSAISKAAAINAISSQTGVTATVEKNTLAGVAQTATVGVGAIFINGVTVSTAVSMTGNAATDRATVVAAINAKSGQTGVTAVDSGTTTNGVSLVAADGRNIQLRISDASGAFTSASTGLAADTTATITYGTFTLASAKAFTVEKTTATATRTLSDLGMVAAGTYGQGKSGQALSTINVSTAGGANDAITAIDNAISSINSSRANLGAIQNRFTSTIATLQSSSENLSAARSRITDADFAAETANLTRAQILQQAGTAMLAQANGLPNGILALLRG